MKPKSKLEKSPWETLTSKKIYENAWYALRQDQVRTHTGEQITYTFMEHPGAVAVVPVTADQNTSGTHGVARSVQPRSRIPGL